MSGAERNARISSRAFAALAFWASFFSLTSVWLGTALLIARSGLGTPFTALAASIIFVATVAFSPFMHLWTSPRRHEFSGPALCGWMILTMTLPCAGLLIGRYTLWIAAIILVMCLAAALPFLRRLPRRELLYLCLFPVCVAYYIFAEVHRGAIWFSHAWLPEHMLMGVQVVDSYYHAAITNMIANYNSVSTGLDGLPRHYYHVGSHYWFAGIGRMCDTSAPFTYCIVHLVVVLPAVFMAFAYAMLFAICTGKDTAQGVGLSLTAVLVLLALLDLKIYLFGSESLALALVYLAAASIILISVVHLRASDCSRWILVVITALLTAVLTAIKGPIALVWLGILGYVWWRTQSGMFRKASEVSAFVVAFLIPAFVLLVPAANTLALGTASALLRPKPDWSETLGAMALMSLALGGCFLIATKSGRWSLQDRAILEVIAVGAIAASILCVVAFNGIYFVWAFTWIALPLVLERTTALRLFEKLPFAWLSRVMHSYAGSTTLGVAIMVVLSFVPAKSGFGLQFELPGERGAAFMLKDLDIQMRGELLAGYSARAYFLRSLKTSRKLFGDDVQTALKWTTGSKVVQAVRRLSFEHKYIVYVSPTDKPFWNVTGAQCSAAPFFIPALIGAPMLLGLPPFDCPLKWYGFENYPAAARSHLASSSELCNRALIRGFDVVIELQAIGTNQSARLLNCKRKPPELEPRT